MFHYDASVLNAHDVLVRFDILTVVFHYDASVLNARDVLVIN